MIALIWLGDQLGAISMCRMCGNFIAGFHNHTDEGAIPTRCGCLSLFVCLRNRCWSVDSVKWCYYTLIYFLDETVCLAYGLGLSVTPSDVCSDNCCIFVINSNWRVVIARLLGLQFSWRWLTVVAFAKFIHIPLSRTSLTTLPTKRDYRVVWCVCGKICVSPGCSGCSGKVLGLNLHWKALSLTRSRERNGRSGIWLWRRTNIDNWIEWNWQGQWSAIRTSEGQWNKRYCWSKRCTNRYTRLWVYCPPAAAATGCWWWVVGGW